METCSWMPGSEEMEICGWMRGSEAVKKLRWMCFMSWVL